AAKNPNRSGLLAARRLQQFARPAARAAAVFRKTAKEPVHRVGSNLLVAKRKFLPIECNL
ncbi:hypothetical protein CO157_01315, partial [Candidatus Peregrinibacteria bacterium CG_4_9_14_3_um_filter_49_12]